MGAGLQTVKAQYGMKVWRGGTNVVYNLSDVDSVQFVTLIPIAEIRLSQTSVNMTVGESRKLSATVYPVGADGQSIKWESSDPYVADVSSNGTVKAQNSGSCVIVCRATDGSNVRAECLVNVSASATDEPMSPVDQKEYLETVALEFMDMIPSSDFQDIGELTRHIRDTYVEDYDWDNVEDWANDAFDAAREAIGTTMESKTEQWWDYTYKYNYIYNNYKALLMAANFKGHFTARDGQWDLINAEDLQFIFNDGLNRQCVLKVETSGNVKKVHAFDITDWTNTDRYENGTTYTIFSYYDRTQCTIGVPERIVVTLTRGGEQIVKTTVSIDLGSITNEEFDISLNSLSLSALIELNNGYKIDVTRVAYTASTNASVAFVISKNGTELVSMGASANVYDIPSVNVSAFSSDNYNSGDYDFDSSNAKNAFVKLDILGKVQIQGTLSNVRKYVDYLDEAKDNKENERTYKSYINQANSLANINLFYDGNSVKQASVKLEPFEEETWNGRTYWEVEPVICFYDGSSYSTFEAFFNDKDFKTVIDTFKALANRYADLIGERTGWEDDDED